MCNLTAAALVAMAALGLAAGAPGAYEHRDTANAVACARACEDDGLCQTWRFEANSCDLFAVLLPEDAGANALTGVSSRAPSFGRPRVAISTPAAVEEPAEHTSIQANEPEVASTDIAAEADLALLGGPDDGALRARQTN